MVQGYVWSGCACTHAYYYTAERQSHQPCLLPNASPICGNLAAGGQSPHLELVEYDLRGSKHKGRGQASRTIRARCRGVGCAEHTYSVDILFDEATLLQDEDYSSPTDLIRMLPSATPYNFQPA